MRYCKLLLVVPLCAALAGSTWAKETIAPNIGKKVDEFSLKDYRGKPYSLSDFKDSKLVVVAFLGVECPLSKLYAPRLVSLAEQFESKGVAFVAVDPNRHDAVTEMGHFANEHTLTFPFLKDLNNKLADDVGAARVPEVVLLDKDRVVRYAGRVDDQYGYDIGSGYAKPKVSKQDLANAINELLAGKEISKPRTEPIGCLIGRVREAQNDCDVTYSNQIARIFQERCIECHRPGQIGPFALQSYDDAVGWSEMIDEVVRDGRMPPWHPEPGVGHFLNDISLTQDEKDLIYKWVAAGAPQGDPKDLPAPKEFPEGKWMIPGGPDAVFHITDEPVDVPAEGTVEYRYYVVDTGFKEDKWVKVAEALPDNRGVVHHIIVFMKPPGRALFGSGGGRQGAASQTSDDNLRAADGETAGKENAEDARRRTGRGAARGEASFGMLCGFAPGTRPYVLPDGMAKLIPAGSQLVFQMHYTPNGSPQKDRSSVGIKFCDPSEVIKYRVATANATNALFKIPPGDPNYKVESERTYGGDALLISVFPHMHLRGKSFHYELIYPDGRKETVMNMPRYDFNWQTSYVFSEPVKLSKGTTMHCTAYFDNSADNPYNPDPEIAVRWGDQTWEEMMIGWFDIAVPKDANIGEVLPPRQRRVRREQEQEPQENRRQADAAP
jgi:peroxiredoxin/mono/diheme cytochrome c family protein